MTTALTTNNFPYTLEYVRELLALTEPELEGLTRLLNIVPKQDLKSGKTLFMYADIERMKKAVTLKQQGMALNDIARHFATDTPDINGVTDSGLNSESVSSVSTTSSSAATVSSTSSQSLVPMPKEQGLKNQHPPSQQAEPQPSRSPVQHQHVNTTTSSQIPQDNIALMVEAVSQVKEGILKDLSRLLDDKLSGLDEVVIELIRCKSENDSLKKRLAEVSQSKDTLETELARFKPVQFGFYRKS
jgi:DNA-binding transcriptional MerR regulator